MPLTGKKGLKNVADKNDQTMGFDGSSISDVDSHEIWIDKTSISTKNDEHENQHNPKYFGQRIDAMGPAYTFILPDLYQFPETFRQFLEHDMIELPTLRRLEQSGHLNWWCVNHCQKLYPLVTTGDGNCLLHAASLGTWGVHDRQLHLRETLYNVLKNGARRHAFWRRWRWSETKNNLQSGLVLSEEEWTKEWEDVLQMAAPTPRSSQVSDCPDGPSRSTEQIYESLETIHVFALAHILKRPIVIVSDTVLRNANGEELSPIPFGGIYLPLEWSPESCHRSPLILCYDSSHFSALVAMKNSTSQFLPAIPIMDKNRNILPVHFAIDPSPDFTWWKDDEDKRIANELDNQYTEDYRLELIARYMDVVKMDLRRGSIKKTSPFLSSDDPIVPLKLMSLATSGSTTKNGEEQQNDVGQEKSSKIMREIRNHLKKIGRSNKKEKSTLRKFLSSELRQSNCILTALLHNFAHQYTDSMVDNYISGAKRRFDEMRTLSTNYAPKNRMSRSFSSSSVLLTCLNTNCDKPASPSTNFLCQKCFENQKKEMSSYGTTNSNRLTTNTKSTTTEFKNVDQQQQQSMGLYASYRNTNGNMKSNTMPMISSTTTQIIQSEHGPVSIASTEILFDSEPDEFDDENEIVSKTIWNNNIKEERAKLPPPVPPRNSSTRNQGISRTNIHITPGTVHCHVNNSTNTYSLKLRVQFLQMVNHL